MNEFYLQLSEAQDLTFNPVFIIGGTELDVTDDLTGGTAFGKGIMVAQQAIVHGDIRATSPEQFQKLTKS